LPSSSANQERAHVTTFQNQPAATDTTALRGLYERGDFPQALRLLEESGLLAALETRTDDPELTAAALTVANLYRDLGRFATADPFYLQALRGLAQSPGKGAPAYASGLAEFARLYRELGRPDQALSLLEQARKVHETTTTPDPVAHSRCLQGLADLYEDLDRRRDARDALVSARKLLEQPGTPAVERADLLQTEAWVLYRFDGGWVSVTRQRQALAIYREHCGQDHPGTVQAGYRLGCLLLSFSQLEEAAPLIEAAVELRRRRFGEEAPRHAYDLTALAQLRLLQGEPREAERLARRCLELMQTVLGDRHPYVAEAHCGLGTVLQARRELTEARSCLERALEIERDVRGEGHSKVVEAQRYLAELDVASGRRQEGVERLEAALEVLERHPDDVRFDQVHTDRALAGLFLQAGKLDEAARLLGRARSLAGEFATPDPLLHGPVLILAVRLALCRGERQEARRLVGEARRALANLPPHHPDVMELDGLHAALAHAEGNPAEAVRTAREAVRRAEQAGSPWLPHVLGFLAEELQFSGDFVESERAYEKALDVERRRRGADHPDLVWILRGLARLHLARGNVMGAEVRFRQALDIRSNSLGDSHPDTAESLTDVAGLLNQRGDFMAAESLVRRALEIRSASLGESHPDTLNSHHSLALVLWGRGATTEAVELIEKAVALTEPDGSQRSLFQHTLARLWNARGERFRALALLGEVLSAQEKVVGTSHGALIPVLTDLAGVQSGLGDHLAARELLERTGRIRASAPVADPVGQAGDTVALAASYRQLGNLERAGSLGLQVVGSVRARLPGRDPRLVGYLREFAYTCRVRRDYGTARQYYQEALDLVVEFGGSRHSLAAAIWGDLAGLEVARGKPAAATALYQRAAEMFLGALGEDHPDHAAARRILGLHLQVRGDHAGAERELGRHVQIVRRSLGADHPCLALAQQDLADLRVQSGDLAGAEAIYREALELIRRSDRPADAVHARLLHGLGLLTHKQGRLDEAAGLLRHVLEIDREAKCEAGAAHLGSLWELAHVDAARGEIGAALEGFLRVLVAQDELIPAFACLTPGPGRDHMLSAPWRFTEPLLTLALQRPESVEPALAAVLHWKALQPRDLALQGRETLRWRHASLGREIDRLFDLGIQIACRLMQGPGQEGLQGHADLLRRWEEERRPVEDRLAAEISQLARLRSLRGVSVDALRKALPAGATLLELVRFRPTDFKAVCAGGDGRLPARYLAFVVRGGEDRIELADLGPAADVEGRRGGDLLKQALADRLGSGKLIVATDGRLDSSALRGLGQPGAKPRELRSGRELISSLLAPVKVGWLERLRSWFGG
jgi:tetratricopeptide (TPR) repeat protein